LEKFGLIFHKHFRISFSANFFSSTSFENGFCLQLFFKKRRTKNEFEFTTKIAVEIESWLMWLNVSRLVAFCEASELRTFS